MRPKMLFGYPSALSHIARHAEARGRHMDDLGIRVAFVTSERLYDEQRQQISKTFGCPVANGYGAVMRVSSPMNAPRAACISLPRILLLKSWIGRERLYPTANRRNRSDPSCYPDISRLFAIVPVILAYWIAGLAVCGRGLPLLREIQGRSTDFVVAQDGTVIHGLALIYILRDFPQISNFKIMQESLDLTRVLITAEPELSPEAIDQNPAGFQGQAGAGG